MSTSISSREAARGFVSAIAAGAWMLTGCAFSPYNPGGSVGTTGGGAQDVASARAAILDGRIPEPDSISVEGFLSEHDIAITPPADVVGEFFTSYAVAWRHPHGEVAPMAEVYLAVGTTIDVESFRREPQNLVLVIDRSGSMGDRATSADRETKLESVKRALHALLDQLNGDDLVTIVSFHETSRTELRAARGDDRQTIERVIDGLVIDGGTNIGDALRTAYMRAAESADGERADRVILFTDAMPNVGDTQSEDFLEQLEAGAAADVGFTLMGVGFDFGNDLAYGISQVRGGNSFFLADDERIATIFDEDFDFLVTPAAYDVAIETVIPEGIGIRDVYGVPDYLSGSAGARIEIPTLFFSRREGGGTIIVRLTFAQSPTFEADVPIADVSLTYTPVGGTAQAVQQSIVLPAGLPPDAQPPHYSDDGARRAAILLDTVLSLRRASEGAINRRETDAIEVLRSFLPIFDLSILGMSDATDPSSRRLSEERDLVEQLQGNIQSCERYGCSNYAWYGYY